LINYFNYTNNIAEGWWGRRDFMSRWWRLGHNDPRWVPPYYPALHQGLDPTRNRYLAQRSSFLQQMEALPRRGGASHHAGGAGFAGAVMEEPVAATVVLVDKQRRDRTAYLGLLQCVNDSETLERLLGALIENLVEFGCQRIIGPTGLSPHSANGGLQNFFHVTPPLHTPYNPPYLPELMESVMSPLARSHLYFIQTPTERLDPPRGVAQIVPFTPARLSGDLLPLLSSACAANGDFPAPDRDEANFLVHWLQVWPLSGWLAMVNDQPVGFILLQPDVSASVRRANGGRNVLWRLWLDWRSKRPVRAGRLLFGTVLLPWRGQGIGHQLWQQALWAAQQQNWQSLTIGPVAEKTAGSAFLEKSGAKAQQQYTLYEYDL
jgi:GNAT superfamily N-acetyltransferase